MSRKTKLILYGSIIIISIIFKTKNNRKYSSSTENNSSETLNTPISNNDSKKDIIDFPTPENGHSPYDPYFGKGISLASRSFEKRPLSSARSKASKLVPKTFMP